MKGSVAVVDKDNCTLAAHSLYHHCHIIFSQSNSALLVYIGTHDGITERDLVKSTREIENNPFDNEKRRDMTA